MQIRKKLNYNILLWQHCNRPPLNLYLLSVYLTRISSYLMKILSVVIIVGYTTQSHDTEHVKNDEH